jgi:hypothetical protein
MVPCRMLGRPELSIRGRFLYIYIYHHLLLVGPGASPGQGARAASIGNFWAKAFNYIYRDIYYLPHLGTVDGIYIYI